MNITIQNAEATVTCRTHGAELLSYKTVAGKEYMWQKDPAYWAKTSPVLFPYIGAVPGDRHHSWYRICLHAMAL